mmetsp:Transcript_26423/g.76179  ORF Transcript_26423/g.76179 Transcript_26423/m.76179 type:complete len:410 (+) Transcript_26423:56-1285(+)
MFTPRTGGAIAGESHEGQDLVAAELALASEPSVEEELLDVEGGSGAGREQPRRIIGAAALRGGVVALLIVAALGGSSALLARDPHGHALVGDAVGLSASGQAACAQSYTEDCRGKGCCSEYTSCFEKNSTWAACLATCALGASDSAPPWDPNADFMPWTCKVLGDRPATVVSRKPAAGSPSLYCYMVALVAGNEPELVRRHLATGTGIFGCSEYDLYSEREMVLGYGPSGIIRSTPIGGPMSSTQNNTRDFLRAWRKIREHGAPSRNDWTVKIDPDAVFFADVLGQKLAARSIKTATDSVYFKNCDTWHSLQGPLEVMSKAAATKFFHSLDVCYLDKKVMKSLAEDWFVAHCLDRIGARHIEDVGLLEDEWCHHKTVECVSGMAAYHPFKTTDGYEKCRQAGVAQIAAA